MYMPERAIAMEGWYQDEACTIQHGSFVWYHTNRAIREIGSFDQGKKHGTWIRYNEQGQMLDSTHYEKGMRKGLSIGWHTNGKRADSSYFDGAGNGTTVAWNEDGIRMLEGKTINDTAKDGLWKYYHANGTVMATEEYVAGERKSCACFTELGKAVDPSECLEKDAAFKGGDEGWIVFLQRNLNPAVAAKKGAPFGAYTVMYQFIVEKDGSIGDIKALTSYGYGMEAEVLRVLKKSPKWVPANQFGTKVRAYRRQPITFVVEKG